MTGNAIRLLLQAQPFERFTIVYGGADDVVVDDPTRCRLNNDELYIDTALVSHAEPGAASPTTQYMTHTAGRLVVLDLRLARRVVVHG